MSISKTIKSLRSQGKRNTSPIKRRDGGDASDVTVPDPDDAAAVRTSGARKMLNGIGIGAAGGSLVGGSAGTAMAIDDTKKKLGKGPIGKVGKVMTGIPMAIGSALVGEAIKRAGPASKDFAEAERLSKSPPQSRPPESERKGGGRVGKRK